MTHAQNTHASNKNSNESIGYLSSDSKQTFTITAGILGGSFLLLQFVMPFVAMMAIMPTMGGQMMNMKMIDTRQGAFWNGALWLIEEPRGPAEENKKTRLMNWMPGTEALEENGELSVPNVTLLASSKTLWAISPAAIGIFNGTEFEFHHAPTQLADISSPFLINGTPAVIEMLPEGLNIRIWKNEQWQMAGPLRLPGDERSQIQLHDIQMTDVNGSLSVFLRYGNTIFHRTGLGQSAGDELSTWERVVNLEQNNTSWQAVPGCDEPTLFIQRRGSGSEIQGWHVKNNGQPFFTLKQGFPSSFGVYATRQKGEYLIASTGMPGSVTIRVARDGAIASKTRLGDNMFFPFKMFGGMMFAIQGAAYLTPFILAFILSGLMKRHRVPLHRAGERTAEQASLIRRALAQLVDVLVFMGPVVVPIALWMGSLMDMEDMPPSTPFKMMGIFALIPLWGLIVFFLYSFLEGRYGVTPGKLATGIRVLGTDLQPCGFGRAAVRNLLKAVDGFFNFIVGIMVIALTENWQRVGDMAARTVVVRTKRPAD